MSFKRDGNDTNLLKNLQHRRVTNLLGDHIPNDEASLLSNGRLTCTVCSKRPIFDTMQMLSLHRKGKKHLFELSVYLRHKSDLERKKMKQTQRSFLKTNQMTLKSNAPGTFIGYPRNCAKRKRFGGLLNRKYTLDITESCEKIKSSLICPTVFSCSANSQVRKYLKSLPRKQSLEKTVNKLRENLNERTAGNVKANAGMEKLIVKKTQPDDDNFAKSSKEVNDYKLKLLESGWIQDGDNKWVKNPEVEFDSDEEEPPLMLP